MGGSGRTGINNIVADVDHCRIWPGLAAAKVRRIEALDRGALTSQVSDVRPPSDARAGRIMLDLKAAIRYSTDADASYVKWLVSLEPRYERLKRTGCVLPVGAPDYQDFDAASQNATRYKQQFVHTFDPLAKQFGAKADWRNDTI